MSGVSTMAGGPDESRQGAGHSQVLLPALLVFVGYLSDGARLSFACPSMNAVQANK